MAKTDHGRRFVADYLKIPEVARRLDVSEKTARRYIKAGMLPSTFIGGKYRVTEEDLEEFVRTREVRPKAGAPPDLEGPERRTARDYQVGEAEAFFVPLEEGEEEDKIEIRIYYVRLLEGDEPILKAMRKASPEEAEQMREELERPRS